MAKNKRIEPTVEEIEAIMQEPLWDQTPLRANNSQYSQEWVAKKCATEIANMVCQRVNESRTRIASLDTRPKPGRYVAQGLLEEVIRILQERV